MWAVDYRKPSGGPAAAVLEPLTCGLSTAIPTQRWPAHPPFGDTRGSRASVWPPPGRNRIGRTQPTDRMVQKLRLLSLRILQTCDCNTAICDGRAGPAICRQPKRPYEPTTGRVPVDYWHPREDEQLILGDLRQTRGVVELARTLADHIRECAIR